MSVQSTALSSRELKRYFTKKPKTEPMSKRDAVRSGVREINLMSVVDWTVTGSSDRRVIWTLYGGSYSQSG